MAGSASVAKKLRADAIGGRGAGDGVDDDGDDVIACQNLTAYYLLFPLFCYRINTQTHTLPTPYTHCVRSNTASFCMCARVMDLIWLYRCALYPRIRIAMYLPISLSLPLYVCVSVRVQSQICRAKHICWRKHKWKGYIGSKNRREHITICMYVRCASACVSVYVYPQTNSYAPNLEWIQHLTTHWNWKCAWA